MGMLNLLFWLGGAFYQQISGLILESFPERGGHIALAGYQPSSTCAWAPWP